MLWSWSSFPRNKSSLDGPHSVEIAKEIGPIYFHRNQGLDIKISDDMRRAPLVKNYHNAVCLKNRPFFNEQIHINISNVWSERFGIIRFGYTSLDPSKIRRSKLPSKLSDGRTKKQGYYAMELPTKCVIKDKVLSFYVKPAGFVNYTIGGVEAGTPFSVLSTSRPLWVVIDIYANNKSVKILDAADCSDTSAACGRLSCPVKGSWRPLVTQKDSDECVVCMDRTVDCVLVPCAHKIVCYQCADTIRRSVNACCPICRHAIAGINRTSRP